MAEQELIAELESVVLVSKRSNELADYCARAAQAGIAAARPEPDDVIAQDENEQ